MSKLSKAQIIFLSVFALIFTYFLAGFLDIAVNKALKKLPQIWSVGFTAQAIVGGYPKIYQCLFLSALFSFGIVFIGAFLPKKRSLFGDARFATASEVEKMNLYGNDGIIIGKYKNKLLRYGGTQFVALGAPTRAGKGVSIVIPNLMEWNGSAVVQDIKQECFAYTSKFRKETLKQDVFLFNPYSRTTHRYNPLAYIDINGENADSDLNDFAEILYPIGSDSKDSFFSQQAQNLFIGMCYLMNDILTNEVALAILKHNKIEYNFTLYGILALSRGFGKVIKMPNGDNTVSEIPSTNFKNTWKFLVESEIVGEKAMSRINDYLGIDSDNTRSGVEATFKTPLMKFAADDVRLATSANDFDLRELRKKKMTIYIGITPDKLTAAKQILNIFWQQLFNLNTKTLPDADPSIKHKVLLVMDEFPSIGELPIYRSAVGFIAGFWLRSLMIFQSDSQLKEPSPVGYGENGAKTLIQNHACQIYFTPKSDDAKAISELLGDQTVKNRSRSYGGKGGGGGSESDHSRRLMLPQELQVLPKDVEIIKIDNGAPIWANKAFYHNDNYFMDKFRALSPSMRKIKGFPSENETKAIVQLGELAIQIPQQSVENMHQEWVEMIEKQIKKVKKNTAIQKDEQ